MAAGAGRRHGGQAGAMRAVVVAEGMVPSGWGCGRCRAAGRAVPDALWFHDGDRVDGAGTGPKRVAPPSSSGILLMSSSARAPRRASRLHGQCPRRSFDDGGQIIAAGLAVERASAIGQ